MHEVRSPLDPRDVTVVVAMPSEERPMRRLVPQLRVVRAGIGLGALTTALDTAVVLSVGLAGGLEPGLRSGTVVIPAEVGREDGTMVQCDTAWSTVLERASVRLGFPTVTSTLLSAGAVITHDGRAAWFSKGFSAVDMETGLLAGMVARVAAVRVILDTPDREQSAMWDRPERAVVDPRRWREAAWIMRSVPRYCRRAALVVAAALAEPQGR
jgi:4-hydroxy-3-methylbut-2-enyl diphosphate reductase